MEDYHNIIKEISQLIHRNIRDLTLKNLVYKTIGLTYNNYYSEIYNNLENYYLTDKIDGFRAILYNKNKKCYIISNDFTILQSNEDKTIILDCEILLDDFKKFTNIDEIKDKIYLFDILYYDNENLVYKNFSIRLKYLQNIKNFGYLKDIVLITKKKYCDSIKDFLNPSKYKIDGLIYTKNDNQENYFNLTSYKWKSENTIDFLMKYIDKNVYHLYCGINERMAKQFNLSNNNSKYFPIKFSPSNFTEAYIYKHSENDNSLDNVIGEFLYRNNKWELIKIRSDRIRELKSGTYFGNNYKIAELTWINYFSPLNEEDLCKDDKSYFQISDSKFLNVRRFNSFVKHKIYKMIGHHNTIFDLAAGKGQDLNKDIEYYKEIHCCDIDNFAISQLIERKYNIKNFNNKLFVYNLDLRKDYKKNIIKMKDNIKEFKLNSGDTIIMNFALHYFIDVIDNLIEYINCLSHRGSNIVFTCFNGENLKDMKTDKYYIEKIKDKVKIRLPCQNGISEEFIVDFDMIIKKMNGYELILNKSFKDYLRDYNKIDELNEDDKEFVSMYSVLIFRKK